MIPHSKPSLGTGEAEAAARVIATGMVAQGREVAAFEAECAARIGRTHGIAVSSGTAALHLAMAALELPEGARVAYPAYTCAALPCAIAMAGLEAMPRDVDADGNLLADAVPGGAGAVIVPHLFGKPAPLPQTAAPVIEDLAQSFGNGTGRAGVLAIASFYATKLLTTGEGGMVFTNDDGFAEHVRDLRDYDKRGDGKVRFNYKMTDIQAAIGRVQLQRLDGFLSRRREIAARYTDAWKDLPLLLPTHPDHAYYRYAVRPMPDAGVSAQDLLTSLNSQGINAKAPVHPPDPPPRDLPGAAAAFMEFVSVPIYPLLSDAEEIRIMRAVQDNFD